MKRIICATDTLTDVKDDISKLIAKLWKMKSNASTKDQDSAITQCIRYLRQSYDSI